MVTGRGLAAHVNIAAALHAGYMGRLVESRRALRFPSY